MTGPVSLKVERPDKTLRTLALERMRNAILDGHFKPGARLVERDLCDQLGVSRTIVREVLRHLESEGLVAASGQRGPIVAITTTEQAMQIYEIRGALEGLAASACAERGGKAAAEGLQAALDRIRRAYTGARMDQVLAETSEFYRLLFEGAGHDVAWGIVSSLTARITRLRAMTIKTPERNIEGPRQMQRIVDAINDGDGAAAATAAQAHVARASELARASLDNDRSH